MASKAQIAADKAMFDGLTKGEAAAFFLCIRYIGAEGHYKSVRKYKARFIEEGLLTEAGKLPEHEFYRGCSFPESQAKHDERFTDKGRALYLKMLKNELAPVEEAYRRIEEQQAATIDLRTREP